MGNRQRHGYVCAPQCPEKEPLAHVHACKAGPIYKTRVLARVSFSRRDRGDAGARRRKGDICPQRRPIGREEGAPVVAMSAPVVAMSAP
eukprot:1180065-Prorocentrum_minimum.AAC.1